MALKFEKELLAGQKPASVAAFIFGIRGTEGPRLGDVIDTSQLVTRHALRKAGIDPDALVLVPTTPFHVPTLAASRPHDPGTPPFFMYSPKALEDWDAEDFYVILAHETAHLLQPLEAAKTEAAAMQAGQLRHKDAPQELDAQVWEARQAARFQWDDDRYKVFVDRLYGPVIRATFGPEFDITDSDAIERLGYSEREFIQVVREEAEERPWSFASVRRRPVRVRSHLRRRK